MLSYSNKKAGFTLIELLVSVAIFATMTALLVAKYGNFNQSVLLTNLAYDVALTIRTAQTYGLSVKGRTAATACPTFQCAYGVHFNKDPSNNENELVTLFVDLNNNNIYNNIYNNSEAIETYTIKHGAIVSNLCIDACSNTDTATSLDITFKRPDPVAIICKDGSSSQCSYTYAKITLQGTDGSTRSVVVRQNGQISVENI